MYADNEEDTSIDVESGEKIPDIVELAFLTTFQLDGRRKMVWKATSMHPGQKLASIYRSGVSCRIIISRNWSRENSLLVSRTGAPVFYSVVIVYCGERKGGEREKLSPTSPR